MHAGTSGFSAKPGALARVCVLASLTLASAGALGETSLSAYTGISSTASSDLHIVQPRAATDLVASSVHWDAHPFRPAPYYGLRLSWFPTRQSSWGAAMELTHYKVYANTGRPGRQQGTWMGAPAAGTAPLERFVQRFELSHGVNMLSANVIYRRAMPRWLSGRLQPYVGGGPAWYIPHAESVVGGVPHEADYRVAGFAVRLFAGLQYRLSDRISLFAETQFDRGHAKVDIADGTASTRLQTVHLVGGATFEF